MDGNLDPSAEHGSSAALGLGVSEDSRIFVGEHRGPRNRSERASEGAKGIIPNVEVVIEKAVEFSAKPPPRLENRGLWRKQAHVSQASPCRLCFGPGKYYTLAGPKPIAQIPRAPVEQEAASWEGKRHLCKAVFACSGHSSLSSRSISRSRHRRRWRRHRR